LTTSTSPPWSPPSSLYLHIPFCPYKCPYCDFATHVGKPGLVQPYVDALCLELDRMARDYAGYRLETVFLGGGTPGMLLPAQVEQILVAVERSFGIEKGAEISIETNPDTIDPERMAGFKTAGINRISIGVQSLDRDELKLLGRGHSPDAVADSVGAARAAGFENLSLDLIYGVQLQTMTSWLATLRGAIALEPDHFSLYSLIVEPKTPYFRLNATGQLQLPEDDLVADMYLAACDVLAQADFVHYEVANWARPGFESRHNRTYWRNEQFLAAGVGAYDYLRPYRSVRVRSSKRYIDRMTAGQSVIAQRDLATPEIERFETAVMGLRLLGEGLVRERFNRRFAEGLDAVYGPTIRDLEDVGFLWDDGQTVRLLEDKVPLANEAWERFLPPSG